MKTDVKGVIDWDMKAVAVSSCKECPYHGHTESDWFCKKMQLSQYTWRKIDNIDGIHEMCPLPDLKSLTARP